MDLSLSHILVTALVVFVTVFAAERTTFVKTLSRPKRALFVGVLVFLVMLLLNFVWPDNGQAV